MTFFCTVFFLFYFFIISCPADTERCTCIVTNENGILKATRIIESMPCIHSFKRNEARYFQQDSGHNDNHEEIYDDESSLGGK